MMHVVGHGRFLIYTLLFCKLQQYDKFRSFNRLFAVKTGINVGFILLECTYEGIDK